MSKVVLIDYGVGNLLSVARALEACGGDVTVTNDVSAIKNADRVVLPGVGAFGDCMGELERRDLVAPVVDYAKSGKPFLGICVGMQLLCTLGEEFGEHPGLGLIPGRVQAISSTGANGKSHKIPHVSWAPLQTASGGEWSRTILDDVEEGASCYFVHSFAAQPENDNVLLANTDYDGIAIAAVLRSGNIYGTQFHPEKSGEVGLKVISNFLCL